jgi:hypothetical protein
VLQIDSKSAQHWVVEKDSINDKSVGDIDTKSVLSVRSRARSFIQQSKTPVLVPPSRLTLNRQNLNLLSQNKS